MEGDWGGNQKERRRGERRMSLLINILEKWNLVCDLRIVNLYFYSFSAVK